MLTSSDDTLSQELQFLYARIDYERQSSASYRSDFKLETMRRLLEELGNPQLSCGVVHIAGTKGKGSVGTMMARAVARAGISVGLYSSPHLETIHERIDVNGIPISDKDLVTALRHTRQAVSRLDKLADLEKKCSFFEMITATALWHFAQKQLELVILEVGLGGRLDSTNVCQPELCLITNISIDHTRQLGSTVDRIAREKAGIIKFGVPVISGVTDLLAAPVIREVAEQQQAAMGELGRDFQLDVVHIDPLADRQVINTWGNGPDFQYQISNIELSALGEHQARNAALSIAALQFLARTRPSINEASIRQGLADFHLKGRFEIVSYQPLVILDMAHNAASIEATVATLSQLWSAGAGAGRRRLVFGSCCDKDIDNMLRPLLPAFDEVVFTRFTENPRATAPEELMLAAKSLVASDRLGRPDLKTAADPQTAWGQVAPPTGPDDTLCVTGSAFLVAELRPLALQALGLGQITGVSAVSAANLQSQLR